MSSKLLSITSLVVAVALFLALNAFSGQALKGSRIDLTERKLYSLSQGTRNILDAIREPITVKFYYNAEQAPEESPIPAYAQRVQELLEEYTSAADGMVKFEWIEPAPYTEAEDEASQAGVQGQPVNRAGDLLFFGLVATNSVDDHEVIPFFNPTREEALEYDITSAIYRLSHPDRPVVALLSSLPLAGGGMDPRTGRAQQGAAIYDFLKQTLDVRSVEATATEIDADVDVLLIVHPKELSEGLLYAIDQFALRGGSVVAFVDPYSYFDPAQGDPRSGMAADKGSNLPALFQAWGVELVPDTIAGDKELAMALPTQTGQIYCPLFVGLDDRCFNPKEITTRELSGISMLLPGELRQRDVSATTFEPILTTTEAGSGRMDSMALQFGMVDFESMSKTFAPDQVQRTLAARVTGTITTAFPEGPPKIEGEESAQLGPDPAQQLRESKAPFHGVLVADVDMLFDPLWVQRMGPYLLPQMGNGSVPRQRDREPGRFERPHQPAQPRGIPAAVHQEDRTGKGRRGSPGGQTRRARSVAEGAEANIQRLQGPSESQSGALLNPDQEAELEKAQRTYMDKRRELREVRSQLNRDIKALGTRLKFFNTAAVPLVLLLLALGTSLARRRSHKEQE
ncbi:MAG: GldG family protein [Planctomycetota bacterium]